MLSNLGDRELAELATRESFEVLFHRHKTPIYHFIARQVSDRAQAEDLFQTVFLKAFRSLSSFRGGSAFRTWLFSIAVNAIADVRRRLRPAAALSDEIAAPEIAGPEGEELEALARSVIHGLPERHRQLFLLVRFHRMRIAEAAAVVGLTPGSAKVTLFRIQTEIGSRLKTLGVAL